MILCLIEFLIVVFEIDCCGIFSMDNELSRIVFDKRICVYFMIIFFYWLEECSEVDFLKWLFLEINVKRVCNVYNKIKKFCIENRILLLVLFLVFFFIFI